MRKFNTLTGFLLSKSSNPTINDTVKFQGYDAVGDGGDAVWKHNGITGQTPSQSPAQLGDGLLNDGNGNQWKVTNKIIFLDMMGVDKADPSVFNAASKAARGSTLYVSKGSYTGDGMVLYGNTKYVALSRASALIGAYDGVVFSQPTGSTSDVFVSDAFKNNLSESDSSTEFSGFTVTGENGTSGNLLTLSTAKAKIVGNSFLNSRGKGIYLTNKNASNVEYSNFVGGSVLDDNTIRDCQLSGVKIVGTGSLVADNHLIKNHIGKNNKSATSGEYNLYIERATGCKIRGNIIWQGAVGDVYLNSFSGSDFIGNQIESKLIQSAGVPFIGTKIITGPWSNTLVGNEFINSDDGASIALSYTALSVDIPPSQALSGQALTVSSNSFNYTNKQTVAIEVLNNPPKSALTIIGNAYGNTVVSHNYKYSKGDVIEGVFTPTTSFDVNGDYSPVNTTQEGSYSRVGDLCNFDLRIKFSSNAYTTASGRFLISGLPFNSSSGGVFFRGASLSSLNKMTYNSGELQACPCVIDGGDSISIRIVRSGLSAVDASTNNFPPSVSDFDVWVSGTYQVEDI